MSAQGHSVTQHNAESATDQEDTQPLSDWDESWREWQTKYSQSDQLYAQDLSTLTTAFGIAAIPGLFMVQKQERVYDAYSRLSASPEHIIDNLLDVDNRADYFQHKQDIDTVRTSLEKHEDKKRREAKKKGTSYTPDPNEKFTARFLLTKKSLSRNDLDRQRQAHIVAQVVRREVVSREQQLRLQHAIQLYGLDGKDSAELLNRISKRLKDNPKLSYNDALAYEARSMVFERKGKDGKKLTKEEEREYQKKRKQLDDKKVLENIHQQAMKDTQPLTDRARNVLKNDILNPKASQKNGSEFRKLLQFIKKGPLPEQLAQGFAEGDFFDEIMGRDLPEEPVKQTTQPQSPSENKQIPPPEQHPQTPLPPSPPPLTAPASKATPNRVTSHIKMPNLMKETFSKLMGAVKEKIGNLLKSAAAKLLLAATGIGAPIVAAYTALSKIPIIGNIINGAIDAAINAAKKILLLILALIVLILFVLPLLIFSNVFSGKTAENTIDANELRASLKSGNNSLSWYQFKQEFLTLKKTEGKTDSETENWQQFAENNLIPNTGELTQR